MSPADLLEVEFINADYVRRSYLVKYSEQFRFYFLNRMTRDEVCVFKVFDSADTKAKRKLRSPSLPLLSIRRYLEEPYDILVYRSELTWFLDVPHAAFEQQSYPNPSPRESLEVRVLVVSEY